MRMTWARGGLTALVLGHVAGCQAPTEVTLAITTNVDCEKLQGTAIVVGKDGKDADGRDPATITQLCVRGRIGDIVLLPGQSREGSFAVKIVAAVGDGVLPEDCLAGTVTGVREGERGCIVARRELRFIPHQPLDLPIALHRACIGVVCPSDQTCVEDGHCGSALIGDPALCAGPGGCNEASLGTGGTGAGTGSSGSTSQSSGTGGTGGTGSTGSTSTITTGTGVGGATGSTSTITTGTGVGGATGSTSTITASTSVGGAGGTTSTITNSTTTSTGTGGTGGSTSSTSTMSSTITTTTTTTKTTTTVTTISTTPTTTIDTGTTSGPGSASSGTM